MFQVFFCQSILAITDKKIFENTKHFNHFIVKELIDIKKNISLSQMCDKMKI